MPFGQVERFEHRGVSLAFERQPGRAPTFVWLGGFRSDMSGTKATALAEWARTRGQGFVRFDYSGHGASAGRFEDGDLSAWLADALAVIDALTEGPLVAVGSSMGGWIALRAARARPERIAALLLIAPAADFTERLMWARLPEAARRELMENGSVELPSAYAETPTRIGRRLIEDGRRHLVMDAPIPFAGPIRVLQGGCDPDVPPHHVARLFELLQSGDKRLRLIEDGDHRLSRPQDIAALLAEADALAERLAH